MAILHQQVSTDREQWFEVDLLKFFDASRTTYDDGNFALVKSACQTNRDNFVKLITRRAPEQNR